MMKPRTIIGIFFIVTITEDEEIDIHTFFGGIEIIVPTTVNVEVKSQNFIGGVDIKN